MSRANLIVTDFEATCWDRDATSRDQYQELLWGQEIIEIGTVVVAPKTQTILHRTSIFIRPRINPVLSEFCTKLTGITQEMVNGGLPFISAIQAWTGLFDCKDLFASWGDWDRKILKRNIDLKWKHHYPFSRVPHVNIKQLVADELFDGRRAGIKTRCQELNIDTSKFRNHRALDDAEMVVLILDAMCLYTNKGLDVILAEHGYPLET